MINAITAPPCGVYSIADLKGKTVSIGGTKDVTLICKEPFIGSAGLTAIDPDFVIAVGQNGSSIGCSSSRTRKGSENANIR